MSNRGIYRKLSSARDFARHWMMCILEVSVPSSWQLFSWTSGNSQSADIAKRRSQVANTRHRLTLHLKKQSSDFYIFFLFDMQWIVSLNIENDLILLNVLFKWR